MYHDSLMRIMGFKTKRCRHGVVAFALMAAFMIEMIFLRQVIAVTAAVAFFAPVQAAEPADRQFDALAQLPPAGLHAKPGEQIEVDIDLSANTGFTLEVVGERVEARYRMAFNQIAEGWSWRPLADPAVDDYYQYKFLPLQSVAGELQRPIRRPRNWC